MDPVLVNIAKTIGADRYNGGWTKSISGIDRSKGDGYSLLAEFVQPGLRPVMPGLYVDCNIGGSRKNPRKHCALVEVAPDGSVSQITSASGSDWAPQLWASIDEWQRAQRSEDTRIADLRAERDRLLQRLAEIDSALSAYDTQSASK